MVIVRGGITSRLLTRLTAGAWGWRKEEEEYILGKKLKKPKKRLKRMLDLRARAPSIIAPATALVPAVLPAYTIYVYIYI